MSDYSQHLHRIVSSYPISEFAALVYLTDPQGNLLLMRAAGESCWKLPGGAIEPEESVLQCLQRTVTTQTGVFIEGGTLVRLFADLTMNYTADDSANISPIYAVFIPDNVRGMLKIKSENGVDFRFFASWNIPMNAVFPPMFACVRYYQENFADGIPLQPLNLEHFAKYD